MTGIGRAMAQGARQYALVALIWLIASAFLLYSAADHIAALDGWDPDDTLRLVQLRDWLAGQSWFDTTQYRLAPPDGVPMHWNRLVELPLALIVWPLTPLIGRPAAEQAAMAALPLVWMGAIMAMLAHATHKFTTQRVALVAVLLLPFALIPILQLRPMRIDHHGAQMVLAMLALSGLLSRGERAGGAVTGFALALWLAISLEGLPLTAGFFVVLGINWLVDHHRHERLAAAIATFAIATALLYPATRGFAPSPWCDAIGPAHVAAIGLIALLALPVILRARWHWILRAGWIGGAGLAGGAVFAVSAPQCLGGAFAGLDPVVREYWYDHVREGLPIWHQSAATGWASLCAPLIGVFGWLALRRGIADPTMRRKADMAGALLAWSTLVALLVIRAGSVATLFALPFQALLAVTFFNHTRRSADGVRRATGLLTAFLLLVPAQLGLVLLNLAGASTDREQEREAAGLLIGDPECAVPGNIAALDALPTATFLTPMDIAPMLLQSTKHSALASAHHRNVRGMRDHIDAWRFTPDKARPILARRGIGYVALCPGTDELDIYADLHPDSLAAQLERGKAPGWLEPLSLGEHGLKVWRVDKRGAPEPPIG